ncbi:MAG: caspase family protein [Armatimonadota bacterium]
MLLNLGIALAQVSEGNEELKLPEMQPKKWAICIGVSNYSSLGKLNYGAKDCISFADTLKSELGFSSNSVSILADQSGYETPNAVNVRKALDTILSQSALDSGDLFIVYFSGHGIGLPSGDYWMPNDAAASEASQKGISVTEILERLAKKKLRNVVVISDACRAGEKNPFGRNLIELGKKTNIGILLGCSPGMKSYEAPSLGHGTFTYFLNRAIQKKSAVDPAIGAMLLSKLGVGIAKSVEEYTRHDYGDNAQKPSIFAEKEQEVVLTTLAPKKDEFAQFLQSYKGMLGVGSLSNQQYKDALMTQVFLLRNDGRNEEALSILRVLQSYGSLDTHALYSYVLTCQNLGLSYELNSVLQKNNLDDPNSVYDDLAVIHGKIAAVGETRFLKALWNLYYSDSRDVLLPMFDVLLQRLSDGRAEQQKLVTLLKLDYPKDQLIQAYANLLKLSQDQNQSGLEPLQKLVEALDKDSKFLDGTYRILYRTFLRWGQYEKCQRVVTAANYRFPKSTYWEVRSLIVAALLRDPNLIDKAKVVLKTTESGESVYSLITILRASSIALEPEFLAASQRLPNSLEAQTAYWIIKSAKDTAHFEPVPDSLVRLSRGHLNACKLAYSGLSFLLDQSIAKSSAERATIVTVHRRMANDMCLDFDQIGDDPDLVVLLCKLLNRTDESYRIAILTVSGPWENIEDRLYTNKAGYLKELYLSLLNNGLYGITTTVLEKLEKLGGVDNELLIRIGLDALIHSELDKASSTIERLKLGNPNGTSGSYLRLLSTHLAFLKGDKEAIKAMIEKVDTSFAVNNSIIFYLHYLKYVSSEASVPSEDLLAALMEAQPELHDLWSMALVQSTSKCRQGKTEGEKQVADGLPFWAISEPLNGNFTKFGYNDKSDVVAYSGHYEYMGFFTLANSITEGTLIFDVDADGSFKGVLNFKDEEGQVKMTGKVNGFGRVVLSIDFAGKPANGSFAFMPHKNYLEMKSDSMPTLQMLMSTLSPYPMGFITTGRKEK